jgi:hypothetical protein
LDPVIDLADQQPAAGAHGRRGHQPTIQPSPGGDGGRPEQVSAAEVTSPDISSAPPPPPDAHYSAVSPLVSTSQAARATSQLLAEETATDHNSGARVPPQHRPGRHRRPAADKARQTQPVDRDGS